LNNQALTGNAGANPATYNQVPAKITKAPATPKKVVVSRAKAASSSACQPVFQAQTGAEEARVDDAPMIDIS
jgi:hypothetical protein